MITEVPWDDPEGAALRASQRVELDARYGRNDHEAGGPPSGSEIMAFLVARDADGRAVACGGLRDLGEGSGEIKRMYVDPAVRGTGVATAVLRALEERALAAGWHELRLETGTAQPDAIRFYQREGYTEIPCWGHYSGSAISRCFARPLRAG